MASNRNGVYDTNLAVAFLWPFKTLMWAIFIYALLGCGAIILALLFAQYYWLDPIEATDMLFKSETFRVHALTVTGTKHLAGLTDFTSQWTYWLFFQATTLHDATYAYFNHVQVNQVDQIYLREFVARNAKEIYVAMNAVSYTHLDVCKRQVFAQRAGYRWIWFIVCA